MLIRWVSLLLVLSPIADAQPQAVFHVTLEAAPDMRLLDPGRPTSTTIGYEWMCSEGLPLPPGEQVAFDIVASASAGLLATVASPGPIPEDACIAERAGSGEVSVELVANGTIASGPEWIVEFDVPHSDRVTSSQPAHLTTRVLWQGNVSVGDLGRLFFDGTEAELGIPVTNLANGVTRVDFSVASDVPGLEVFPPTPLILGGPDGSDRTQAASLFAIRSPDVSVAGGTVWLTLVVQGALEATRQAPPITFAIQLDEAGAAAGDHAVPSLFPVLVLLAAAALRRR